MAESTKRSWAIAALIFIAASAILFAIVGYFGGTAVIGISNAVSPAVSGETPNVNGLQQSLLRLFSIAALSLAGGIVASGLYWFRDITPKREVVLVSAAFVGVALASGANFSLGDSLITWRAQIAINVVLAILSLSLLIMLSRWQSRRPTLLAIKMVSVCLIATFGLFMPLIWTLVAMLYEPKHPVVNPDDLQGMITLVSGVVGLVLSLLNFWKELAGARKANA
jgi:hypothetical protein